MHHGKTSMDDIFVRKYRRKIESNTVLSNNGNCMLCTGFCKRVYRLTQYGVVCVKFFVYLEIVQLNSERQINQLIKPVRSLLTSLCVFVCLAACLSVCYGLCGNPLLNSPHIHVGGVCGM